MCEGKRLRCLEPKTLSRVQGTGLRFQFLGLGFEAGVLAQGWGDPKPETLSSGRRLRLQALGFRVSGLGIDYYEPEPQTPNLDTLHLQHLSRNRVRTVQLLEPETEEHAGVFLGSS